MEGFESSYKMPEWLRETIQKYYREKNVFGIKRISELLVEMISD